jgi:hypothetical protein
MWEYSWNEATGALITEFMALGNHRKSIRSEIAKVTERMRKLQVDVLADALGADAHLKGDLSLDAVVLLITGLPKFLNLERGVGVKRAHADVVQAAERYLDSVEPLTISRARKPAKKTPRPRRPSAD